MILVFHNPKTNFFSAVAEQVEELKANDLVAEVNTNDLETAYMLTNHIDEDWYTHPDVKCIRQSRSTSVGDFMVKDGRWWVVDGIGFKRVYSDKFKLSIQELI